MKSKLPFCLALPVSKHDEHALLPGPNQNGAVFDRCANQKSSPDRVHNQPSQLPSGAFFHFPVASTPVFPDLYLQ